MTKGKWILRDLTGIEEDRSSPAVFDADHGGFKPTAREAFGGLLDERQPPCDWGNGTKIQYLRREAYFVVDRRAQTGQRILF
jgi:hypothetical protein